MSGLRELLDQLDTLRAAGTPGPWSDEFETYGAVFADDVEDPGYAGSVAIVHTAPNAALIVAAVNALPELVARLRAVADLADNCASLGAVLHNVPMATAYADAATEIRAALDGEQQ